MNRFAGRRFLAVALGGVAWASCLTAGLGAAPVRRARDIYDCAAPLPTEQLCREGVGFTADEAARRLGAKTLAYWIEGHTLNIAARSDAGEVRLSGTIQEGLQPLAASGGRLWGGAYYLPQLERSLLEIRTRDQAVGTPSLEYRGRQAPASPPIRQPLAGRLEHLTIASTHLGEPRQVSVYLPRARAPRGGFPTVYMPDGEEAGRYAAVADALIAEGRIEPAIIVGAWAPDEPPRTKPPNRRTKEYVPGYDDQAFARHEAFVLEEVAPLVESRFGAAADPRRRMLFGFSNGADWVLATASRHPEFARNVAAFSATWTAVDFSGANGLRLRMGAGVYEGSFLRASRTICDAAQRTGANCDFTVFFAGHGFMAWQVGFADALTASFPRRRQARASTAAKKPSVPAVRGVRLR